MYPEITINKNSEFFVALCKDEESVHSFITLGVVDNGKKHLLGSFGKLGQNSETCGQMIAKLCGVAFWHSGGFLRDEPVFFSRPIEGIAPDELSKSVSYKAYALNYKQYVDFLLYLKYVSTQQTKYDFLHAYCPVESANSEQQNAITFQWENIEKLTRHPIKDSISAHQHFSIYNTCRHSAIELTKKATQLTHLGTGISSSFLTTMPLTGEIKGGKVQDDYFFILPLPPKAFPAIDNKKLKILNTLYKRLDKLIQIQQYNPLTQQKFSRIKELYLKIIENEAASTSVVFKEITDWVSENKNLISTHRKSHWFFFKTATEKAFENLLEKQPGLRNTLSS